MLQRGIQSAMAVGLLGMGAMLAAQAPVAVPPTQAPATPASLPQEPGDYVLHAYVNLVQVPTLILSTSQKPLPTIPPQFFRVSLDRGKPFLPRHVRREGDDPIHLAILVERSGTTMDLLPAMAPALTALIGQGLRPEDRISLTVLTGCTMQRTPVQAPAQAGANRAYETALHGVPVPNPPTAHDKDCAAHPRLWNAAMDTLSQFHEVNSRRVLLLLTDGVDTAPTDTTWVNLREQASRLGVAIFGMRSRDWHVDRSYSSTQPVGRANIPVHTEEESDTLASLAESSGGLVLSCRRFDLRQTMLTFVDLVRDRYIVEFPRPLLGNGHHLIGVSVGKRVFVTTAAVSVNLPDPKELATDETRVPSADSAFTVDAPGPQLRRRAVPDPGVPADTPEPKR